MSNSPSKLRLRAVSIGMERLNGPLTSHNPAKEAKFYVKVRCYSKFPHLEVATNMAALALNSIYCSEMLVLYVHIRSAKTLLQPLCRN